LYETYKIFRNLCRYFLKLFYQKRCGTHFGLHSQAICVFTNSLKEEAMKKSTVMMGLLFVCLLSFFIPNSVTAANEIKLGYVFPLSGGAATQGMQCRTGAEIAADEINAAGGIKSLNGAKVNIIFGDSKSTPDGGAAEAERLVTRENVSVLGGSFQSSVTFTASEVAERYKTPWVCIAGVKDEITERGFKYVFRDWNKASYDIEKEVIPSIELFAKETGAGKPQTFGLLCEGTDWGRSVLQFAKKFLPSAGYKLILEESYPPNVVDFTSQILKIKAAKPDMLILAMYTPDHILFSKQQMEQKLYFPYGMWSIGAGCEDPAFYKAVPQATVEHMFVQEDWDVSAPKQSWYPELNNKVKAKLGYDMNAYVATAYTNTYLIKDALERAASTDKEKIRAALAATNLTAQTCGNIERQSGGKTYCPALIRGVSQIKFDAEGQNTFSHGVISQNQKGERVVLFPLEGRAPGTKVTWPIPPWDKR
jgi:branched-chain amino acid transport system substrate-binding protein